MKNLLGIAVLVLLTIASCTKDAEPGSITFNFTHKVADQDLVLDDIKYTSLAGHSFSVVTLKYYVSNISFHNTDGTIYNTGIVHYREEGIEDTKTLNLTKVPAGTYNKISFTYGLDEATNIDDGLENTLTNQKMEWPIPGDHGYHYMKFEGKYDSLGTGVIKNFNLHTGAAQNNQYFIEIALDLPSDITIDNNGWDVDLVMDLNQWLENPTTWDFAAFGQAIMMNTNAQEVLQANGVNVFSVDAVSKR